jgi:gas vesicle protein
MGIGGAAYGGFQGGYGIGSATQSGVLGAVGGAFSGAKLGAALGGPVGAAVGGIAGFVGGLLGAADASRAARERILELRAAFQNTFDSLRAELNKDTLGQAIAQVKSAYQNATQQFKEANSIVGTILSGAAGIKGYAQTMAELSAAEAARIEQLKQEAAVIKQQAQEDLDVRTLRDQGRQHDADILQKRHEDERELAKAMEAHMSDAYLAQLKQNQAMEEAAVAAGTTASAFNALATSVRGGPGGFKLNGYIQQFGDGAAASEWPSGRCRRRSFRRCHRSRRRMLSQHGHGHEHGGHSAGRAQQSCVPVPQRHRREGRRESVPDRTG